MVFLAARSPFPGMIKIADQIQALKSIFLLDALLGAWLQWLVWRQLKGFSTNFVLPYGKEIQPRGRMAWSSLIRGDAMLAYCVVYRDWLLLQRITRAGTGLRHSKMTTDSYGNLYMLRSE